jgi:two-component system nitrogen regulation response regulator NtrX
MFPTILIVDDEPSIRQSLKGILSDEGFEILTASNGYEALKVIQRESPDLVLLDIWMPGIDGIETLQEIKKESSFIQVVIITGHGTIETAVKATKMGAFDFIEKPLSIDKIIVTINNALSFRRLEEENRYLRKKALEKNSLTGASEVVTALRKKIAQVAPSDAVILITGENGTGKELVARSIHQMSQSAAGPFVTVNCAAIPEDLIESELFGHEKGAFGWAKTKRLGKFELAQGGTLFLDEIGDMSLKTQAKVLRVLEDRQFQRVGASRIITADLRVIAASNKRLDQEIKKGHFREDLYFRLNVLPLEVPPLRHRVMDIPQLVETFMDSFCKRQNIARKSLDEGAIQSLCNYGWPGNVRELKNLVERLCITVEVNTIRATDLPNPYSRTQKEKKAAVQNLFEIDHYQTAKQAFERAFLLQKFHQNQGDVTLTAASVGLSKEYLQKKIKALNFD